MRRTLILIASIMGTACLARPVGTQAPTTKISFETVVAQPAIDKIDLIVMVDNSSSMADKQRILADAVPDLVNGLLTPKCVDKTTRQPTGALSEPTKADSQMCPAGSEPAFPPISDLHIGVISSSLGAMGGTECQEINGRQNDDHGRLLSRGPNGAVANAGDLGFLAWYPDVAKNQDKTRHPEPPVPAIKDAATLEASFRDLVVGVGQQGCGLEAQLESVYRFLVQPDPWVSIDSSGGAATYGDGIDDRLLKQRAAFLRPDSLVAVIVLTDEDDSSADPLAFEGQGYRFMSSTPLPRATSACDDDPESADCKSCSVASCPDPKYTPDEDYVNVRFHHMKKRFGVDPQFPIKRYVDALSQPRVPARAKEHDKDGTYAPQAACTNPLFAAKLPTSGDAETCELPRGPRSPSLVYFALIGGVPNDLLGGSGTSTAVDWTKLLGRAPDHWDEEGIDPRMVQSSVPRSGRPAVGSGDPGREWTTQGKDLEYACTFDLYERPNGTGAPVPARHTCVDGTSCDCNGTSNAPLCAADDPKVQVKGKAYPTRRELMVAKGLGDQGVVASLCPAQLTAPDADDYGYRPAVRSITQRLERSLVGTCLPRALERQGKEEGSVACLVLAMLPDGEACKSYGLSAPEDTLLDQIREQLARDEGKASAKQPICEIPQLVAKPGTTCRDAQTGQDDIAFCYAEAPAITQCAHSLTFTKASEKLAGARFTMHCIQQPAAPTDN